MTAFIDVTGQRFGRLVAVYINGHDKHKRVTWHCVCDCGGTKTASGQGLRGGSYKTCGCSYSVRSRKHGGAGSKLYNVWCGMKNRCSRECGHKNYAGRGITVCPEWQHEFAAFDMWARHAGYREGLEIDRIDNDGNYEPGNCRWVTRQVNNNNRSTSIWIEYQGQPISLADLARETGIHRSTLQRRVVKLGLTGDEAVKLGANGKGSSWVAKQLLQQH